MEHVKKLRVNENGSIPALIPGPSVSVTKIRG